jgi:hypothetical protein
MDQQNERFGKSMSDCAKIAYPTTRDARIAATAMQRRKGSAPIRIYLCKECGNFHTTSMRKGEYKPDARI